MKNHELNVLTFKQFVNEHLPLEITDNDFSGLDYMIHSQETADSYDVYIFTDDMSGKTSILEDVYYYDDNLLEAICDAFMKNSYAYNFEEDNKIYMDEDIFNMVAERWEDDDYLKRDICDAWDIEIEDDDEDEDED